MVDRGRGELRQIERKDTGDIPPEVRCTAERVFQTACYRWIRYWNFTVVRLC